MLIPDELYLWECSVKQYARMQRSTDDWSAIEETRIHHGVLCTAHNTHAILGHAATPPHNKLRRNLIECFNINIRNLARLNCKLPDDGRRPKHVGAI